MLSVRPASAQQEAELVRLLGPSATVGNGTQLIQPFSYAVFSSGELAVLEFQSREVVVYTPEGGISWRYGQQEVATGDGRIRARTALAVVGLRDSKYESCEAPDRREAFRQAPGVHR